MSLDSSDPSDIANASRCFASCVPMGEQQALRTYLLTQLGNVATPPCVTPTAPTSAGAKSIGNTAILMSWSQPPNSGSFIKNYIVYWGTVSGVYTNNSGLLPAMPRLYTISGLSTGTTYFWVVQAVAFSGCNSAVSSEKSATTTGASPSNGLLQSLVSYWKFDVLSGATAVDSVGANDLTLSGASTGSVAGVINTGLDIGGGGSYAQHATNSAFDMGAGVSFTFSIWVFASSYTPGGVFTAFLSKSDEGATAQYELGADSRIANGIRFIVWDLLGSAQAVVLSAAPPSAGWHHIVVGVNAAGSTMFGYFDGVSMGTPALTAAGVRTGPLAFRIGEWVAGGQPSLPSLRADECGLWHRALSATDVGILYNAGAGTPLSNFGA